DLPAAGAWNMAVDEMLLNDALRDSIVPTLRIYSWSEPTLSLGYFQRASEVRGHPNFLTVPLIRRCTGGGAILHDHEWTYSLILPACFAKSFPSRTLYQLAHLSLRQAFLVAGISTYLHESSGDREDANEAEFLCFSRRAEGDLIAGGFKIAGSAQRRRQGAL